MFSVGSSAHFWTCLEPLKGGVGLSQLYRIYESCCYGKIKAILRSSIYHRTISRFVQNEVDWSLWKLWVIAYDSWFLNCAIITKISLIKSAIIQKGRLFWVQEKSDFKK